MKLRFTILVASLFINHSFAAQKKDAESVIKKTSEILNNLKKISYSSYREINNFKDNYFSKNSGDSYFEYDDTIYGKVNRFQLRSSDALQVYNGTEYFMLNDNSKTVELEKKTPKQLNGISLLYNSITTIRLIMPLILADQSIQKSLKDTLIEGKNYDLVKFQINKGTIEYPVGISTFDSEVIKYYKLIIDKQTALPYMVFDGNSISKDQYYTKTIFTDINVQPSAPTANSWFYSSYKGYEPKKKVIEKPMITVGDRLMNWSLPKYDGKNSDTLKSSQLNGKIVLMEFWIKNCGYCMLAFPEIKELQNKYGNQIEIISVNAYEKKEEIDFFYKREKPNYTMLYDGEKMANSLGIYAYPSTIMLDKSGKVIFTSQGFDKAETEKAIQKALQ